MTFNQLAQLSVSKPIVLVEMDISGTTHYYSFESFTPVNSTHFYEGRLHQIFSISRTRDATFFGRMVLNGGSISLINADGEFDAYGEDAGFVPLVFDGSWKFDGTHCWNGAKVPSIYGSQVRIKYGYDSLDIASYLTVYTGYIESISFDEQYFTVGVIENRKKFDTKIKFDWTNKNALTIIEQAITLAYPTITYTSTYYNTTVWDAAKALAPNISVDMVNEATVTEVIERICLSIFGEFVVDGDGRYSFKYINPDAIPTVTIPRTDIVNAPSISYDTSQIITSVIVDCDITEDLANGNYKLQVHDNSRKGLIFARYQIYKEQEFVTYLQTAAQAASLATKLLDYYQDAHAMTTITVPMKYYALSVGDVIYADLPRGNSSMLGVKKYEIMGITYNLEQAMMDMNLRMTYD